MEAILQPPQPFLFENDLTSVTSGNLSKDWEKWKSSFRIYYEACELNKKEKKVQINILLHIIGEKCREVYEQFNSDFKNVEDLLKEFDGFFLPRKNITIERHAFFIRDQREQESVEQYVFELNKIATKCEFKDLNDELVRDRMICGIRERALRERLLREVDLTLSKAIDICRLAEISRAQASSIKIERSEHSVHQIESTDQLNGNQVHFVKHGTRRTSTSQRETRWQPPYRPFNKSSDSGQQRREYQPPQRTNLPSTSKMRHQPVHQSVNSAVCTKCGNNHKKFNCPAYGQRCSACRRMNHYARMCRVYLVKEDSSDQVIYKINNNNKYSNEWSVSLLIKNVYINFKLDTGADVNILPKSYLCKINVAENDLVKTTMKLQGYSGSKINVVGKCFLKTIYKENVFILKFVVVDVNSPPILGINSCQELKLIKRVMTVSSTKQNMGILNEFPDVFVGIGCLPGTYKIELNDEVQPVVHAPRKLPVALKDQVKNKLDEMQKDGIIEKVEGPTDWVNSMTVVKKPNGDLRICLDPRDLNRAIKREHFKLPTLEEITTNLSGAKYFSTLDAKQGFWHVKLHNSSTDLCTFNTIFGRYKFLRMPYGISSASEIFHKRLYGHFDDMEGVIQFIDDILIYASTKEIHDQRLREVLERCRKINLKLNMQKCKIGLDELTYLGHKISKNGISPDEKHVLAIKNMPKPENVKDLERFLGIVTYVSNFIQNFSEKTAPLRELLKKDIAWHWDHTHDKCFDLIKNQLINPPVLKYYTLEKPVVLSVDASKNGLGACLMQDNLPVCYASKALNRTEQNYAQIEKELYACVFACEKFYMYIYGRHNVTIETDHKPLVNIINKPLVNAPPRLQRMLMRLQPYSFTLVYKPGRYLYIADALSRAVAPGNDDSSASPADHLDAQAQVCAVSADNPLTDSHFIQIQKCAKEDTQMQELIKQIKRGWPTHKSQVSESLKQYWDSKEDLTVNYGLVWKGNRIVIPKCMRTSMVKNIHIGHLGIEKCKLRAKEIMFWPNMTSQIQDYLSHCQSCLTYRRQNTKEPLLSHEVPSRAWYKVGTDLFHFGRKTYLIVVDYYSKFVEMIELYSTTSREVINQLKNIFRRHGIPEIVISDNGPEYSSSAFCEFSKHWNFKHVTSSPTYPQSNGQVERTIQTIKNIMKKTAYDNSDFDLALLEYLNTPISSELASPAELLFNRKLRSIVPCMPRLLLPKIHRDISNKLKSRQVVQKKYYDRNSKNLKTLQIAQKVKVRLNNHWVPGIVEHVVSNRSYLIKLETGNIIRRNRKHIIIDSTRRVDKQDNYNWYDDITIGSHSPQLRSTTRSHSAIAREITQGMDIGSGNSQTPSQTNGNYVTRFGRTVRPPDRWEYSQSGTREARH